MPDPEQIQPLNELSVDPARLAVFSDFDGVIADIAERPDAVHVPQERVRVLYAWRERAGGAMALVSGREIDDLRRAFDWRGAISGGHGAETEWGNGERMNREVDAAAVADVSDAMKRFAAEHSGVLFEAKRLGAVLHYRADPSKEDACWAMVREAVAGRDELEIQASKMAVELKPAGFSKGSVITLFMERDPFRGRTPIYFGDDVTDEAAFREVNARGGFSVKVGDGETLARYRTGSPSELFVWMGEQLDKGATDAQR